LSKIYSRKQIKKILEQEQSRSDRNGHEFSVLVFDSPDSKDHKSFFNDLASVLLRRIRCCDYVGWIDYKILCVVMPETSYENAKYLAENFFNHFFQKRLTVSYNVYTYPLNWISRERRPSQGIFDYKERKKNEQFV
jgi:GGDEF domain-containing protein